MFYQNASWNRINQIQKMPIQIINQKKKTILILGQSQQGKTSLAQTLSGQQNQKIEDGKSESYELNITHSQIGNLNLEIIDTMGQDDVRKLLQDNYENLTFHFIVPYLLCCQNPSSSQIQLDPNLSKQVDAVIIVQSVKAETIQLERNYNYYKQTFPGLSRSNVIVVITKSNPQKPKKHQKKTDTILKIVNTLGLKYIFWQNNAINNKHYNDVVQQQQIIELANLIKQLQPLTIKPVINSSEVNNLVYAMQNNFQFALQLNYQLGNQQVQLESQVYVDNYPSSPNYYPIPDYYNYNQQVQSMNKPIFQAPQKEYFDELEYIQPFNEQLFPKPYLQDEKQVDKDLISEGIGIGVIVGILGGPIGMIFGGIIGGAVSHDKEQEIIRKNHRIKEENDQAINQYYRDLKYAKQLQEEQNNQIIAQRKRQIDEQYNQEYSKAEQKYNAELREYERIQAENQQLELINNDRIQKQNINEEIRKQFEQKVSLIQSQQYQNQQIQYRNSAKYPMIAQRYLVIKHVTD